MKSTYSLCIVAGEASGDVHGALLVPQLHKEFELRQTQCELWGIGGPLMRAAGVRTIAQAEDMAVMGFAEILKSYLFLSSTYKKLLTMIMQRKPDALVLIDYPGFNLRLAQDAFALGITVIYHIPPKVWAHGRGRTHVLRTSCHLVTSILPFEMDLLRQQQVRAVFVGNPLKDKTFEFEQTHTKPLSNQIAAANTDYRVGLIPGSRKSEIERILPVFLAAFAELKSKLKSQNKTVKGLIPVAPTIKTSFVEKCLQLNCSKFLLSHNDIDIIQECSYDVMKNVAYAWVGSGTATLETAFFLTPMSVCYIVHPLSYAIVKMIITTPYVSLVNLCAQKVCVPEFLQDAANPKQLADHAYAILTQPQLRSVMIQDLKTVRDLFLPNSSKQAAAEMVNTILDYDTLSTPQKLKYHHWKSLQKV